MKNESLFGKAEVKIGDVSNAGLTPCTLAQFCDLASKMLLKHPRMGMS